MSTTYTSQGPLEDASVITDSRMWIFQCVWLNLVCSFVSTKFKYVIRVLSYSGWFIYNETATETEKLMNLKWVPDSVPRRCQPEFIQVFFLQNSFVLYFELEKINRKFWPKQGLNPESSAQFTNCLSHYTTRTFVVVGTLK